MQIRALAQSDLHALIALYVHLNPDDAPSADPGIVEASWLESLANPRMRHVGAFDGDRLVSACTICVIPNLTRGTRPYALVENVVTAAAYRRRGFGSAVMREALSFAWSQNAYKVMLLTGRKDESVMKFYQSVGFDPGEKRGLVARPAARAGAAEMRIDVD